jgi:hypothetical protein
MRLCEVEGCNNKHSARGYCNKHYKTIIVTSEYKTWKDMKRRCYDINYKKSKNYLGRGIKVCDEWLHDYNAFYKYMGNKPGNKYSIDRIDNNGDYMPGNVRWATYTQQARNKRIQNCNGYPGILATKYNTWLAKICVDYKTICLGTYKDIDDAIKARKEAELKYWS